MIPVGFPLKQRILLIEKSATLRNVTSKMLIAEGYTVTVAINFNNALEKIDAPNNFITSFDTIVMGWPSKTDPDADRLLALLEEPQNHQIEVLILSHEADSQKLNWVTNRKRSALLLWSDHKDLLPTLNSLFNTPAFVEPDIVSNADRPNIPIKILLVDDSPTVRVIYSKLLANHGYSTGTASCVSEGMEKALESHYDIAIVDYFMPDGTGDTLCRMLRDNPKTAKISSAIITGTYHDRAITDALAAGAVECMFKNESHALFLARVDTMKRAVLDKRAIEKDHKRLQGILQSVGDGVYGVNSNGMITFINPTARKILGLSDGDEFVNKSPFEVFHNLDSHGNEHLQKHCKLSKSYKDGRPLYNWATIFRHKNGNTIPVECTVQALNIDNILEGSVVAFRDISERKLMEEELIWQANHDTLTKLPNRLYFEHQLEQEVTRLQRSDEFGALLFIDLDRFKYFNDTAGHATGDRLLIEISRKLKARLRSCDSIARLGGDEFSIILRNINPKSAFGAADMFRRVTDTFNFEANGKPHKIGLTVGVTLISKDTASPEEAMANADIACYIAKGNGRNQTHLYNRERDEKAAMDIELGWSSRLHTAITENQFVLHYQPIMPIADIDLKNLPAEKGDIWKNYCKANPDQPRYYEALIRLPDSSGKLISPAAFLPTAERFNKMVEIDHWVIKNSIKALANLADPGNTVFSINLSSHSLEDESLASFVDGYLQEYDIKPDSLIFEVTESIAIGKFENANSLIDSLHKLGCRFALDDFGSGYSSFSHLKKLPVDIFKIDGIFIQGALQDTMDKAIVASIVNIAHSVGKKTVAEYVENAETIKALKEIGVDYAQGYYVEKPGEL